MPDFAIEQSIYDAEQDGFLVTGVDEVGRGPWAGPVTAAAVILDPDNIPDGINDSKKLSAKKRTLLYGAIKQSAICSVVHVDVEEIDRINILQASLKAMQLAIEGLDADCSFALIDGTKLPPQLHCPARSIVKGDSKSLSIAAASIIAKFERDALMCAFAQQYPGYGWETNMGYGTKMHQIGLQNLGVTPLHRRSFKPIHNILCEEKSVSR